jgi:pSer/pThr/pTyr-binding forkhead associated (FHA) protein
MPRIAFKNNAHEPVEFHEAVTLGRSDQHANVVLDDKRLSRAHCRIEPRDDTWAVVDLESQNGTFLNGRRVQESALRAGDVITLGAVDVVFEADGPGGKTVMAGVGSTAATSMSELDLGADATATMVAPAALELVRGTLKDKLFPIIDDPFVIGRKPECHLVLEGDNKASGQHARVVQREGEYILEDLDSRNGTQVDGERIDAPTRLEPGARVVIGSQAFEFKIHGRSPKPKAAAKAPATRDDETERATETAPTPAPTEDDGRDALRQKVKFKGGGGKIFAVLEILVVLAVAAAVMFGAWTLTQGGEREAIGTGGTVSPARDGGLLTTNPSFDDRDEAGFPRGWRYLISGTDSFLMTEAARGGEHALQISRYSPTYQPSFAISDPVEVAGGSPGVRVSAYVRNPDLAGGRAGSAFVQVWWFEHHRDREPILVSPIHAGTGYADWTEVAGSAVAPAGARVYSVVVGISGSPGSVMFDDLNVSADSDASAAPILRVDAPGGLTWAWGRDGRFTLSGPDGQYLRNARIVLHGQEGRSDPLDPMLYLTEPVITERTSTMIFVRLPYFDPMAGVKAELGLELGGVEGVTRLRAGVTQGRGERMARQVAMVADVTAEWMPIEAVQFAPEQARPQEYALEIGGGDRQRPLIGRLVSAGTASGNEIRSAEGNARVWLESVGGTRELYVQAPERVALQFVRGTGHDELLGLSSVVLGAEEQDHIERVEAALSVFRQYPYNPDELAAAGRAVEAAARHYRLRQSELRDGVDVPELTRNEQLYRASMEEAIRIAENLRRGTESRATAREAIAALDSAGMHPTTRDAAKGALRGLGTLNELAAEFDSLADRARRELFLLEVAIEQRDSAPFMVSARDFLDRGNHVQGMLQLMEVVRRYARCERGVEAKERLAEVAAILLDDMDSHRAQGLNAIALDNARQARDLIVLIRANLLVNLLSTGQRRWLTEADDVAEARPSDWLSREAALLRKLAELEQRLPPEAQPEPEPDPEVEED